MELLKDIKWQYKSDRLDKWIDNSSYSIEQLQSGLEGEAYKLTRPSDNLSIVCKIWNKTSKPDAVMQYRLLQQLLDSGKPVSDVYGCGTDEFDNPLLVTSFDGFPLAEDEGHDITVLAKLLVDIHSIPVAGLGLIVPEESRVFDKLVQYFFPMINHYTDIKEVVNLIIHKIDPSKVTLIHGDYNLGNIVHEQGRYCIIDWTNAQIGDSRYDFAWASFLIKIYTNSDLYELFKETYLRERYIKPTEYEYFEILAFLRWIILSRIGDIPMKETTQIRIEQFKEKHQELLKNICVSGLKEGGHK